MNFLGPRHGIFGWEFFASERTMRRAGYPGAPGMSYASPRRYPTAVPESNR